MNYKLKNQLFFYLTLLIAFLLVVTNRNNGFFWDTIQLASQHGNYYYSNNFSNLLLPIELDSGHIPTFGMYIALIWKVFGRTIEASHLAMLPFAIGIVWQLNNLCKQFIVEKYSGIALLLIFVDASLMSQITLVSPDVPLMFFFLLTLNAVFRNKKELIVIGILGLFLTSMRGMMLSLCLMIIDIYTNYGLKNLMSFDKIKKLLKRSLLYLPALTLFICFSIYHFYEKGWIGYHKDSPWADCFERVDFKGFIFNVGLLGWRILDFGRVGIWIVLFILLLRFKKTVFNDKKKHILFFAFLIILILLPLNMLWAKNLLAHRYLMPLYITFALLTASIAFSDLTSKHLKNTVIAIWLLIGLSGNFWIYPPKISKGWDSTLAHLPYYDLRLKAIHFLDTEGINFKDVDTFFPNYYSIEEIALNKDHRFFDNYTIGNNSNYIFYSNIFNVEDDVYDYVMANYKPIKEFKNKGVYVVILQKSI
jgi:hypothetical protein